MADTENSLARVKRFGFILVGLLGLAVFGWGAQAHISGAIIATGHVAVRSDTKAVQHLEGGIVGSIHVQNGDRVEKGDLLVKLDDTEIRARLEIINSKLISRSFDLARLEAERDRRETLEISDYISGLADEPQIRRIYDGQQKLLTTRLEGILGKARQLQEQIIQVQSQIGGLEGQRTAKRNKAAILEDELAGLTSLKKKGLVQKGRLTILQRESADLDAEIAQLKAETARLKGKISELELKVIENDEVWREKVLAELVDVRTEVSSLQQQRIAEEARLLRSDITAPQAGIVHELKVHIPGAVIGPGEPVMTIVPYDEELVVRVKVAPQDIEQIYVEQPARVIFSAFSRDDVPEFWGKVISVGADLSTDEATGISYYRVDISVSGEALDVLNGQDLKPGMPAEAFIQTTSRTALTYLLKPLSSNFDRAFRD